VKDSAGYGHELGSAYIPTEFHEITDVAACALDDQLEQMQRQYASASRAASSARVELEILEKLSDTPESLLIDAKRRLAAAEIRSSRLLNAIEALEDRLENA
jgi:hypothetical protein